MKLSRRQFLRAATGTAVALSLPLTAQPVAACTEQSGTGAADQCSEDGLVTRPAGDPSFESFWVATHLGTKLWPTAGAVEDPVDPVDTPFWAAFADDGKWMNVSLTPPQHLLAMQGDLQVMRDLVTAGTQGTTKPGFYRILRRVYDETMDSRTIPGMADNYLLKGVLFTQYFTGDGAAIHYNWWGPPRGFGYPGSHGCLGMRMDGSKFLWDWAGIGTPIVIHH